MDREVILTEEGYAKLKEEIEQLSTTKRNEVAERIKEAREFGDISENSEYDDAKNEQAQLEAKILSLEQKLRNARVVDAEHVSTDTVSVAITNGPHGTLTSSMKQRSCTRPDCRLPTSPTSSGSTHRRSPTDFDAHASPGDRDEVGHRVFAPNKSGVDRYRAREKGRYQAVARSE